jgi:hypothetical protein
MLLLLLGLAVVTHAIYSECPPGQVLTHPYDGSPQEFEDMMNSLLEQLNNIAKDELKDAAGEIPGLGPIIDGFDTLEFLNETYSNCRATGSSNCLAFTAFCYGLSQVQGMSISIIPLSKILPPLDKWCKGEPPLKCCARFGLRGCHSAFNDDAPINCEGNPAYGPTWTPGVCLPTNRYPGDPGCLCDYLPKCASLLPGQGQCSVPAAPFGRRLLQTEEYCASLNTFTAVDLSRAPKLAQTFNGTYVQKLKGAYVSEGSAVITSTPFGPFNDSINPFVSDTSFRTINSPDINLGRRSMFVRDLRKQFLPTLLSLLQVPSQRDPVRDFLSFRGCKGFAKAINPLLQQYFKDPAAFLQNIPYYTYTLYNGAPTKNDTFSRATDLFRRTVDFSIGRVIGSLPYFWARFDFASSFEWSQADKIRYFQTMPTSPLERGEDTYLRAEAALLPFLGPIGLAILQSSQVVDWELFAPPLPVSTPGWAERWLGDEPKWHLEGLHSLAGCELGQPPLLSLAVAEELVAGDELAVLTLTFTDPEYVRGLRTPIRVEWGDGTLSRAFFVEPTNGFRMTTSLSHKYFVAGVTPVSPILIKAIIFSGAGLASRASVLYTPSAQAVSTATLPVEARLQSSGGAPFYSLPGFLPLTVAGLPSAFRLRAACGRFLGANGNLVGASAIGLSLSVDSPADLYNATGTGELCRINANGSYVNHNNFVLFVSPYGPNNFNFAWQFFLQTGTSDKVVIWNPWPGDGNGTYMSDDGVRFRIVGTPSIFTLIDSSSNPSAVDNNWVLRGKQLLESVNSLRVNVRINGDARSELKPLPTQFAVLRSPGAELSPDGTVIGADEPVNLTALATGPNYTLPGFRPLASTALPPDFKLTSACGACWSSVATLVYEGPYAMRFNAVPASGPVGTYLLRARNSYLRVNIANWALEIDPLNLTSSDYNWQLFLKDGTTDQVILWSPFAGGRYVSSDGSRPLLDVGRVPLMFTVSKGPVRERPRFHSAAAFTFLTPAAPFSLDATSSFATTSFSVSGAPLGLRVQCRSYASYLYTLPFLTVVSLDFFVDGNWVSIPGGEFTSVVYTLNNSNTSQPVRHNVVRGGASIHCARRGDLADDEGGVLEVYFSRQSLAERLARLPFSPWVTGTPSATAEVRPGMFAPITATLPLGAPCSFGGQCRGQECLLGIETLRTMEDPYGCKGSPQGICSLDIYTGSAPGGVGVSLFATWSLVVGFALL